MGLDIKVIKNVRLERALPSGYSSLSAYDLIEVDEAGLYVIAGDQFVDRRDGHPEGIYSGVPGHKFRAGSYFGYSAFRSALSVLTIGVKPEEVWENPEHYEDHLMYPLIDFSDCEGFIGPDTALTLHGAFESYRSTVEEAWSDGHEISDASYHLRVFQDFAQAFEEAAGNGFVSFY